MFEEENLQINELFLFAFTLLNNTFIIKNFVQRNVLFIKQTIEIVRSQIFIFPKHVEHIWTQALLTQEKMFNLTLLEWRCVIVHGNDLLSFGWIFNWWKSDRCILKISRQTFKITAKFEEGLYTKMSKMITLYTQKSRLSKIQ